MENRRGYEKLGYSVFDVALNTIYMVIKNNKELSKLLSCPLGKDGPDIRREVYSHLSMKELINKSKKVGIKHAYKMDKKDLIEKLIFIAFI